LIGSVLAVGLVLALALWWLGGRAGAGPQRYPMRDVVGLPLAQAKRLLRAPGPVEITVVRVPYGTNGIVLRATGFGLDGTYGADSRIRLQVGGHVRRRRAF
jgi:hypothetical protein